MARVPRVTVRSGSGNPLGSGRVGSGGSPLSRSNTPLLSPRRRGGDGADSVASSRRTSSMMDGGKDREEEDFYDEDEDNDPDKINDKFMVHDAALYTEVLDASDWTEVLRAEKRRKKREALAQHSVEEANERDRRDGLRKKAAEDAKAVREARRKLACAAREERETAAFRERNDDFFVRHNALLAQWDPIEKTNQVYRDRVREQIYRRWEREVFLPTQKEINRKVEEKCAEDTRPHLFDKGAKDSLMEAQRKTSSDRRNSGSSSGGEGGRRVDRSVPLTWKEKKDELWRSFLNESNRKSKMGGRAGLFLDVIDEVEYNPIAQRKADTIRYKKRTLPTSDADQHRMEAQKLELQYSVLGLAYRDQERKSCTGILRERHLSGSGGGNGGGGVLAGLGGNISSSGMIPNSSNNNINGGDAVTSPVSSGLLRDYATPVGHEDLLEMATASGQVPPLPPPPPAYNVKTHEQHNIPHTHVPYEFAKTYHSRTTTPASPYMMSSSPYPQANRTSRVFSTAGAGVEGSGTGAGYFSSTPGASTCSRAGLGPLPNSSARRRRQSSSRSLPVDRSLALANIAGEGSAAKIIGDVSGQWQRKVEEKRAEERRRQLEDRHQSPLAIAAQQQHREENILESDRLIMPLPLKPSPAPPTEISKHLMPWMVPTGGSKLPINERSHYLPVKRWGKAQLHESVFGHYVYPDGSLRPPPENKEEGGWRIHESNVSFDHYNFPKENEETRTGKRMCIHYQL